jgi:hypothetical protein
MDSPYDAQSMRPLRANSRDKVSNRTRLLPAGIDMRSATGRRYRELVRSYRSELGRDLSDVDEALVKQAASLTLAAERLSTDVVKGAVIDSDALVRISSEARRILAVLRAKASKAKAARPAWSPLLARHGGSEA